MDVSTVTIPDSAKIKSGSFEAATPLAAELIALGADIAVERNFGGDGWRITAIFNIPDNTQK